ncbi:MAG TPA: hydroxyacid dehydrogenase [Clostridiaceae bacterium]|nr:hydroxyacid dehydrogenase [Clostridiaceae bacterium]
MKKIVSLLNKKATARIFSQESLDMLSQMGELVLNEDADVNPDAQRAKELIKGANIVITSWGSPKLDADILSAAPDLELVIHAAGSVKGIVSQELWERGVRVTSSAPVLGKGVAETTLGLVIVSLKYIWKLSENVRNGGWKEASDKIREVYDVTIGVIGAGYVGRHFMKLLQSFEVEVLLYDPYVTEDEARQLGAKKVELEELLRTSDVVSIHAPSIPETNKMINRDTLKLMKDDAILINTARGSIIDEEALVEELKKGRLFACLDVTDPEPPAKDHPLRKLPNVIMTPHIAGLANTGLKRIGKFVASELRKYLNGEQMEGEVKLEKLKIMA